MIVTVWRLGWTVMYILSTYHASLSLSLNCFRINYVGHDPGELGGCHNDVLNVSHLDGGNDAFVFRFRISHSNPLYYIPDD